MNVEDIDHVDILDTFRLNEVYVVYSKFNELRHCATDNILELLDKPCFILKYHHWMLVMPTQSTVIYFDPYGLQSVLPDLELERYLRGRELIYSPISYQPANEVDKLCGIYCIYCYMVVRAYRVADDFEMHRLLQMYLTPINKQYAMADNIGPGKYPICPRSDNTYKMIMFAVEKKIGKAWRRHGQYLAQFEKFFKAL